VAACWGVFSATFPVIAESMMINFRYMLSASSSVEQMFTVANNEVKSNASHERVRQNLKFFSSVRGELIQDRLIRPT